MITLPKRIDLINMLPQGSKVAEIGVYRGHFSIQMLNLPNLGMLYLVDPWRALEGYHDPLEITDHEDNYRAAMQTIGGHMPGGRVGVIRKTSVEASMSFKDGELTAVYIDGNHSYESVLDDLTAWESKIENGGFLMGHDYCSNATSKKYNWGVIPAVSDFCNDRGWIMTHITAEEYASFCLIKV